MAKKRSTFTRRPKSGMGRSGSAGTLGVSSTMITPPCGEDATPVRIISDCKEPVFVELCPQSVGIETSLAELGCILGPDGEIIGKVFLSKVTSELDGSEVVNVTAYYTDGTVVEGYTGEWGVCQNPQVDIEKFEYCNLQTGTKWIRECQYVTIGVVTTKTTLDEFDTGFPCIDSVVIQNEYCVV